MLIWLNTAIAASDPHGQGAEHAASGSGRVVMLLALIGTMYLVAHFLVGKLQRRFLFNSGVEYIVLGAALGPSVFGVVEVFDNLAGLAPVIAFAAGWIGLLYGMELHLRSLLDEETGGALRLALADALSTSAAVGLAAFAFFRSGWMIEAVPLGQAMSAAAAMACTAAAGSSSAVDLIREAYPRMRSSLLPLLRHTTRIGDILAIVGLGLLFSFFHEDPSSPGLSYNPDGWFWIIATAVLGLGIGALFAVFLGDDANENSRFLALVGIIVFAAGAAYFLQVSALTVNLLLGAALVNSSDGPKVAETLNSSLKPVTLVLMVFAGAIWTNVGFIQVVVVAGGYIAIRLAAKALALLLATVGTTMRRDLFRGLMAQGDVAVAIAVSFRLVYHGPAADLAYTTILISVIFHELAAPRLLKGLLIDAGELDDDVTWTQRTA